MIFSVWPVLNPPNGIDPFYSIMGAVLMTSSGRRAGRAKTLGSWLSLLPDGKPARAPRRSAAGPLTLAAFFSGRENYF